MNVISKLFGFGEIKSKTSTNEFKVELLSQEVKNKMPLLQQKGFSSIPKAGDTVLCIFPNGNREKGIIIAVESSNKPALNDGDASLHSSMNNYIICKDDGTMEAKTKKIKLESESMELKTKINLDGDLVIKGTDILKELMNLKKRYEGHNHAHPQGPTTKIIEGA